MGGSSSTSEKSVSEKDEGEKEVISREHGQMRCLQQLLAEFRKYSTADEVNERKEDLKKMCRDHFTLTDEAISKIHFASLHAKNPDEFMFVIKFFVRKCGVVGDECVSLFHEAALTMQPEDFYTQEGLGEFGTEIKRGIAILNRVCAHMAVTSMTSKAVTDYGVEVASPTPGGKPVILNAKKDKFMMAMDFRCGEAICVALPLIPDIKVTEHSPHALKRRAELLSILSTAKECKSIDHLTIKHLTFENFPLADVRKYMEMIAAASMHLPPLKVSTNSYFKVSTVLVERLIDTEPDENGYAFELKSKHVLVEGREKKKDEKQEKGTLEISKFSLAEAQTIVSRYRSLFPASHEDMPMYNPSASSSAMVPGSSKQTLPEKRRTIKVITADSPAEMQQEKDEDED